MFICKICNKELGAKGISSHLKRQHQLSNKEYYDKYLKRPNEGKCKICKKDTTFNTILTGYRPYCCSKCVNLDPAVRHKIEKTSLDKYGVKCNLNLEEIKQRANKNSQTKDAKNKRAITNIQKYGATNPFGSKQIIDKMKQNSLKKYGVEYSWQRNDIKTKIKNINIARYGVTSHTKSKEFQQKFRKDRLLKILKFEKENNCTRRQTLIQKYGYGWAYNLSITYISKFGILFVSNVDINKIIEYVNINHYQTSHIEQNLVQFIKSIYNDTILENVRTIIYPYEIDIYLPKLKLAIEFNGRYWHSYPIKNKSYHLDKSLRCREQGIRLIHIYEFEDFEEQKQLLKDLIDGKDNYPPQDFNKNNLIENIPKPSIIYKKDYTIYGAGKLIRK